MPSRADNYVANGVMIIRGYDVVALAKKTWAEIGKDKISVYAAQMAYAFFFALFPLLLFFAALLSLVADKQTVMAEFNGRIAEALPADVASLLGKTIEKDEILVNSQMETGRSGIYAAGDVTTYPGKLKLIATGFGEAATAVNQAVHWIYPEKKVAPGHSSNMGIFGQKDD